MSRGLRIAVPHDWPALHNAPPTVHRAVAVIELLRTLPNQRPVSYAEIGWHISRTPRTIARLTPWLDRVYKRSRTSRGHAYTWTPRGGHDADGPCRFLSASHISDRWTSTRWKWKRILRRGGWRANPQSCGRWGATQRWIGVRQNPRESGVSSLYNAIPVIEADNPVKGRDDSMTSERRGPPEWAMTAAATQIRALHAAGAQIRKPSVLRYTIACCYADLPHTPHPGLCGQQQLKIDQVDRQHHLHLTPGPPGVTLNPDATDQTDGLPQPAISYHHPFPKPLPLPPAPRTKVDIPPVEELPRWLAQLAERKQLVDESGGCRG